MTLVSSGPVATIAMMSVRKTETTGDKGYKWAQATVTVTLAPENAVFVDKEFLVYQIYKGQVRLGVQKLLETCTVTCDRWELSDGGRSLIVYYTHKLEPACQPGVEKVEDANITGARLMTRIEGVYQDATRND
jgi:hypothetical protein